jgi:hypothetical protein
MANFTTNRGSLDIQNGTIAFLSDTMKIRLVKSSVTPDKDNTVMTGLTAVTGTTDQTLGSKTRTEDTTNDRIVYDAADPTFTAVASGDTVGWYIVYKFVTNDADSIPLFVCDVTNTPTNGGDIVVQFDAAGIGYTQQ